MDLLYLLSLLPGGITPEDLDILWAKVTHQNRQIHLEVNNMKEAVNITLGASNQSKLAASG